MTQENKDRLQRLLQQYKNLGIADQIDFDIDKWSIRPSLAEKMVDILQYVADKEEITTENVVAQFGFSVTSAKRYLRQLTEFGYLEAHGGDKNRTYSKRVTGGVG